ncbi:G-protein coupled receptor GRL101-like [Strongylocentrotus purpuratus]|uniref:G-protein coupled receptors family 1 profile domain-containing protein n=1 Tax=Strongylocentrotus purpuratus TaxID=7668 RepID=A0A7M7P7I1_STRPU|nr:G-protein coupled receptor GRL101-like [Strongylocentrotus purpuratus]
MIAGWVIGLTSLVGNLTVLILRIRQEQQLTVQTLLIMNLAVADCLTGIYTIIITPADIYFGSVKRSTQSVANAALRNREIKVARKMAFIVGTDFACWMPIIVMGILTQSGLVVLPTSLYAWSVIFIIPINSSINPVLYTSILPRILETTVLLKHRKSITRITSQSTVTDQTTIFLSFVAGNVCLTLWCNFGMNSQGTCVQYEVADPMPTVSALKCL